MRAGLHLVRPDVSEDSVKIFFCHFFLSFSPLFPLLFVSTYHTPAHGCYVKSFVYILQDRRRLSQHCINSSMNSRAVCRHISCFLFVSHMACFCIFFSTSPTNADTYINTHRTGARINWYGHECNR